MNSPRKENTLPRLLCFKRVGCPGKISADVVPGFGVVKLLWVCECLPVLLMSGFGDPCFTVLRRV